MTIDSTVSSQATRAVTRPNSFIFSMYGDLAHDAAEDAHEAPAIWIGGLIRLMAPFGVSSAAVRQAVSRMSRQGWIVAHKRGTRAYYSLTERGADRIASLIPRIYGPILEWDGSWRLLAYTVPEKHRERRDRLRKELAVLGWAPLAASLWISPNNALPAARAAATSSAIDANIALFEGGYRGPLSDRELVERCWDLPTIAAAYDDFNRMYRPRLENERRTGRLSDEEAFVERLWLVHDYRKFTYVDPGLPSTLLPGGWPGSHAAATFREYHRSLHRKATTFFEGATKP